MSLYSHFKSKENILQKICFEVANAYLAGLEASLRLRDFERMLTRAITEHIKVSVRNKDAAAVMWSEWKHMSPPYYEDFRDMIQSYQRRFTEIFVHGTKSGVFRVDQPTIVSNALLSAMNGIFHWYDTKKHNRKIVTETFIDFTLRGIAP